MTLSALDTDQARNVGVVTIVVVVVIGLLLAVLITKLIVRAIVVVLMIVLALVAYQQRDQLQSAAKKCDATFFGVHVTPHDPTVKKQCQQVTNR
jgi:hypothetical protein